MVKKKRIKRKEKKLAQRKKKEYHSVKKRKNSFVKATGTLVSRSISNKEVAVKPKFAYVIFQTRFPFLYASTGLDIKTLTIASNRNFESCMSIRCLAPQHISGFFIFAAGFSFAFGNFAHYCVVLLKAPLSNLIKKKKHVRNGLLSLVNLDPRDHVINSRSPQLRSPIHSKFYLLRLLGRESPRSAFRFIPSLSILCRHRRLM